MKAYLLLLTVLVLTAFLVLWNPDKAHAANGEPACDMIAKLCDDGSTVTPQGPNCEFPPCPASGQKAKPAMEEPPEADDCDDDDCSPKPTDPNND